MSTSGLPHVPPQGRWLAPVPKAAEFPEPGPADDEEKKADDEPAASVRFAHNSERQFAKLLDFYGIVWEYEPRTFTLAWDRLGRPVQAFSPDFFLPAYDLYIEITTLNQKLVTKKNGKVRRLRQLHPDIKVKVLYQRDYLNLLVKYGLEEPSQLVGLSEAKSPASLFEDDGDARSC